MPLYPPKTYLSASPLCVKKVIIRVNFLYLNEQSHHSWQPAECIDGGFKYYHIKMSLILVRGIWVGYRQ